jgi:hypothetical protein
MSMWLQTNKKTNNSLMTQNSAVIRVYNIYLTYFSMWIYLMKCKWINIYSIIILPTVNLHVVLFWKFLSRVPWHILSHLNYATLGTKLTNTQWTVAGCWKSNGSEVRTAGKIRFNKVNILSLEPLWAHRYFPEASPKQFYIREAFPLIYSN